MSPPEGRCVSVTLKRDGPPALLAEEALVADLAAALRVKRGAVEDDLRLARAGELLVGNAIAQNRERGSRPLTVVS